MSYCHAFNPRTKEEETRAQWSLWFGGDTVQSRQSEDLILNKDLYFTEDFSFY